MLQHRSNPLEEKDSGYRRWRLKCEAADFAHRKTKVQIGTEVDAPRDGSADQATDHRLEI